MSQQCCLCDKKLTLDLVPRMLPSCGHSACTPCIQQCLSTFPITITCTFCNTPQTEDITEVGHLSKNLALIKLLESKQSPKSQYKATTQKSQLHSPSSQIDICSLHHKEMDIICLSDAEKICAHCALFGQHRDHCFKTIIQVVEEITNKQNEFKSCKEKKTNLHQKILNAEFKDEFIKRINSQKQILVKQIKDKFSQLHDSLQKAQKQSYEQLIKIFKYIYQQVPQFILQQQRQSHQYHRRYFIWQQQCKQLFQQAHQSQFLQEKATYYFDGPLNVCSQGVRHISALQKRLQFTTQRLFAMISTTKITTDNHIHPMIFNYLSVQYTQLPSQMPLIPTNASLNVETIWKKRPQIAQFSNSVDYLDKAQTSRRVDNCNNGSSNISYQTSSFQSPKNMSLYNSLVHSPNHLSKFGETAKTQSFDIRNTAVEKAISAFIEKENQQSLDLTNMQLTDLQIYDILRYLKDVKKMKGLKLTKNKLTNQGFIKIIQFIPYVTNLNVSFNQLNQEILNFLIANRTRISVLRIINVSNNKINERKAKVAIDQLRKMSMIATI